MIYFLIILAYIVPLGLTFLILVNVSDFHKLHEYMPVKTIDKLFIIGHTLTLFIFIVLAFFLGQQLLDVYINM